MTKDNGKQAAFSVLAFENGFSEHYVPGLTKREWLTGMALGIYGSHSYYYNNNPDKLAENAVNVADAVLRRLNEPA